MFEILMAIAAVVAMVKIADAENQSTLLWGAATFALCVMSLMLPWPLIRVGMAFAAAFLAMFFYKVAANR